MPNPKNLCLPPLANTLRDLDMRFTWVLIVYNCTVCENRITTLGLSLSGTIAIKQYACNRFLLTIESAIFNVAKKKNTASPWV